MEYKNSWQLPTCPWHDTAHYYYRPHFHLRKGMVTVDESWVLYNNLSYANYPYPAETNVPFLSLKPDSTNSKFAKISHGSFFEKNKINFWDNPINQLVCWEMTLIKNIISWKSCVLNEIVISRAWNRFCVNFFSLWLSFKDVVF